MSLTVKMLELEFSLNGMDDAYCTGDIICGSNMFSC